MPRIHPTFLPDRPLPDRVQLIMFQLEVLPVSLVLQDRSPNRQEIICEHEQRQQQYLRVFHLDASTIVSNDRGASLHCHVSAAGRSEAVGHDNLQPGGTFNALRAETSRAPGSVRIRPTIRKRFSSSCVVRAQNQKLTISINGPPAPKTPEPVIRKQPNRRCTYHSE